MAKKKVLFVATVVKTHIVQFHIPYLKMLKEMGWETAVAAKNDYDDPNECNIPYCDKYYPVAFGRSPLTRDNICAYKELKSIIDEGDFDMIHCHTPVAAFLTRLAARDARKKGCKVILGVETYSKEGNFVSFMEEGKAVMYRELGKVYRSLKGENLPAYGVAIHHMSVWYNLKD